MSDELFGFSSITLQLFVNNSNLSAGRTRPNLAILDDRLAGRAVAARQGRDLPGTAPSIVLLEWATANKYWGRRGRVKPARLSEHSSE